MKWFERPASANIIGIEFDISLYGSSNMKSRLEFLPPQLNMIDARLVNISIANA